MGNIPLQSRQIFHQIYASFRIAVISGSSGLWLRQSIGIIARMYLASSHAEPAVMQQATCPGMYNGYILCALRLANKGAPMGHIGPLGVMPPQWHPNPSARGSACPLVRCRLRQVHTVVGLAALLRGARCAPHAAEPVRACMDL